tara:strand:+ start:402 stop:1721 length:1320 start_codon:yes stop_codon:yes gene_type:complete
MKIHILGISGTFMSGIAILAKQKGFEVSGSDLRCYDPIKSVLEKQGIPVNIGYRIKDIKNKDLIIIGNVMSRGNSVIEYILNNNINYTSGPKWLNENILINKKVIAISGTHGKTTTTSMVVHIMKKNKLNPSYLIGGDPIGNMKTVALTNSKYFVIEADEYDTAFFDKRSKFMHYKPHLLMINNIEYDHADIFNNIDDIIKSFHHLVRIIPSNGCVLINKNDVNIKKLLKFGCWSNIITIDSKRNSGDFNLIQNDKYQLMHNNKKYSLSDNLIGKHNYTNAISSFAICKQLNIPLKKQIESLKSFKGVKKRSEYIGKIRGMKLYDDFAHHPTAIKASISAIKDKFSNEKLLTIFIPNSNSMALGSHNANLMSSLNKSNRTLIITKSSKLQALVKNNIKINVIESKSQISDYLNRNKTFDNVLILSNKNTEDVIGYIKNE